MHRIRVAGVSFLLLLALLTLVLAFIGGPDDHTQRSIRHAWNLGHVFAFALWTYLILVISHKRHRLSFHRQIIIFMIGAILAGTIIELAQGQIGRSQNLSDVVNDMLGSLLAVCLFSPQRKQLGQMSLQLLRFGLILAVIFHNQNMVFVIYDDYQARQQFPVIADFSTPFQLSRWQGGALAKLEGHGGSTKDVLKIDFTTDRFSGVQLQHFPGNWQGYAFLQIDYYNPDDKPLVITCRINDRIHTEGEQRYDDRFNRRLLLSPGWNNFRIKLQDIINAPDTRQMDVSDIRMVGFFTSQLIQPQTLYITDVKLVP